jgi:hypothetical protein
MYVFFCQSTTLYPFDLRDRIGTDASWKPQAVVLGIPISITVISPLDAEDNALGPIAR